MKYFRLDLLTLLVSLFIFSACEKNGTIGLDVDPQDSIKSVFTDTATVRTVTVADDTVRTSALTQTALGFIKDPIFGTTEASLALGLTLPSDNLTFGTNPVLDSAILVIKYGDEFYGDSLSSNYSIDVHQLSEAFATDKNYFDNATFASNSTRIGGLTNVKRFQWNDSTTITSIIKGAADKPAKVAPQIRIPISSSFITQNFLTASSDNFKNSTVFKNFIKGLYVKINQTQSTGTGGVIFLSPTNTVSGLEVYYKSTSGTTVDTNVVTFKLSGASAIRHNRTGTPVAAQLQDTTKTYSTTYVQPLAGVRTKIRFPYIKRFKSIGNGNISINKAELVIPALNADDAVFKPAPRLILYRTDIAGQRQPVPDNAINIDPRFLDEVIFGGFYNSTTKSYSFNITSYIQDLISTSAVQYDTYIGAIDFTRTGTVNISPSALTAARAVLGGAGNTTSPIKLKITYTKPN